ncbi:NAD(P)/FAD-dependent oxidoreductase [Streptococcus porcinus]|uniref:NAD(P)/FAD-dependent oxidoreductase n=1 Tax=Streptococcus porcinus TaxID=1340 RepID=UPI0010FE474B
METQYDITIIGGGPVGLFTAFYAGLRGMKVKIIENLSELGGQPAILYPEKVIYDIPAIPVLTGAELTDNLIKQISRFDDRISICLKEEVQLFTRTEHGFIIKTTKAEHSTKAIIIACGNGAFSPRKLGLDGEEEYADDNIYYNVHKLDQFAGKKIVICGGGDSAVDWALALYGLAESVTLVHRREAFRAHEHSVELLRASGVKILTPYVPSALLGKDGRANQLVIEKVKDKEQITLDMDALIVSYGFSTSNKNLKNWDLDVKRTSINVSHLFETSQEGIFAVGDAAQYEGKVDLIATGFGEAPIAVNQAINYIYPDRDNRVVHSTSLIN